jgi:hypothetical protein
MTDDTKKMSAAEREMIIGTINTPGWPIFKKLIGEAKNLAFERCVSAPNDQRLYQGIAQGIAEVEKAIKAYEAFAAQ